MSARWTRWARTTMWPSLDSGPCSKSCQLRAGEEMPRPFPATTRARRVLAVQGRRVLHDSTVVEPKWAGRCGPRRPSNKKREGPPSMPGKPPYVCVPTHRPSPTRPFRTLGSDLDWLRCLPCFVVFHSLHLSVCSFNPAPYFLWARLVFLTLLHVLFLHFVVALLSATFKGPRRKPS